MARSFQQMIILGHLGKDPEVRYTASGTAVATLTVATSDSRKDKQTDQWIEETEWHRVVLWRRLAEIAGEYLRKGRMVHIVGKKRTRKWQNEQGEDKWSVEIVADTMQIIGARDSGEPNGPVHHNQEGSPQPSQSHGGGAQPSNWNETDDIQM